MGGRGAQTGRSHGPGCGAKAGAGQGGLWVRQTAVQGLTHLPLCRDPPSLPEPTLQQGRPLNQTPLFDLSLAPSLPLTGPHLAAASQGPLSLTETPICVGTHLFYPTHAHMEKWTQARTNASCWARAAPSPAAPGDPGLPQPVTL